MTVTEFVILTLTPSLSVDSPAVQTLLRSVATQQESWSGYPLFFFHDTHRPADIYLISGWQDITAHHQWIASEANQALLQEAASLLKITRFAHLAIDFQTMPPTGHSLRC